MYYICDRTKNSGDFIGIFFQVVGFVQVVTRISLCCQMDLSKLIHGISQSCYMDLSKLPHGFVKVVTNCQTNPS